MPSTMMKNIIHHFKLKPHLHHHDQSKPNNLVHRIHNHLMLISNSNNPKTLHHQNKVSKELPRLLVELHFVLYGDSTTEPNPKACSETALEFFNTSNNPFRLILKCFTKLDWESQTFACQIVINLMGQHLPCSSRFIVAKYLEENMDLVDFLVTSMFDLMENNNEVALLYGTMLRECLHRSQVATMHVLESKQYMRKLLEYVTLPNYTFAAHVAGMIELLLTRHTSTVADFLIKNYEWFFDDFNSKLLVSSNQLTKNLGLSLLGHMLLEGKNHVLMLRYVSNVENLKIIMNALRESKRVQLKAFHVFKLFVENREKAKGVIDILRLNIAKLLQLLDGLKPSGEDHQFDEEKARIIRELSMLRAKRCDKVHEASTHEIEESIRRMRLAPNEV